MAKHFPKLDGKAVLAPMAGIDDVAFRMTSRDYGCALTYTEMISAPALARGNNATLGLIDINPAERNVGLQLFGQSTEEIVKSAQLIEDKFRPDVIDLNMGCPARQIIRQGAGCALLMRKNRIGEIVKACTNALNTPFTLKMRSGIDTGKMTFLEVARIAEDNGAAAITMHARTMAQGYSGHADWSLIKQLKESVSIPVIGNGDVFTPQDAARMIEQTGCDYVMLGRGAMKGPIIFQLINDFLRKREFKPVDDDARRKMVKKYLYYASQHNVSLFKVKLHCQHFTNGMSSGSQLRDKLGRAQSVEELREILSI